MASRGKKDCPNCTTEIAARTQLCGSCGWHFVTKEIRKDLLEKKNAPIEIKTYTSLGQGRKKCPECDVIVGACTKICPKCEFDFSSVKKEVKLKREKKPEKEERKETSLVKELRRESKYVAPDKISPADHAKRVLSYGPDRAKILLNIALKNKVWNHVDWNIVEKELSKLVKI